MDTDPPKSSKLGVEVILAACAAVAALIAVVAGRGIIDGWGVDQWGPVSAWLSSLLTVFAVGVALYQAVMARRDADAARADAAAQVAQAREDAEAERERAAEERAIAEERHSQQLAQSDKLLTRQLDAQQRAEQIESILPIWPAIADVRTWYKNHYTPEISIISSGRANRGITREEARTRLAQLRTDWDSLAIKTDLIFEPAIQLVVQKNVGSTLLKLYYEFMKFGNAINRVISAMEAGADANLVPTDPFMKRFSDYRKVMLNLVRVHLTLAPPIDFDRARTSESTETKVDTDNRQESDEQSSDTTM